MPAAPSILFPVVCTIKTTIIKSSLTRRGYKYSNNNQIATLSAKSGLVGLGVC